MKEKKPKIATAPEDKAPEGVQVAPWLNLVVVPAMIQPIATQDPQISPLGLPIMPEDFVRDTGLMPSGDPKHSVFM